MRVVGKGFRLLKGKWLVGVLVGEPREGNSPLIGPTNTNSDVLTGDGLTMWPLSCGGCKQRGKRGGSS